MSLTYGERSRLTGSALNATVAHWGRRGVIKSIQRGTIVLNNVTSATATVTAVDPNNTVLEYLGQVSAGTSTDLRNGQMAMVLTDATTITVTVNIAEAVAHTISWELIEYLPGVIKSIQRGVITGVTTVTQTATITAVDPTRARCVFGGWTVNDGTAAQENVQYLDLVLTNSTTVTARREGPLGTFVAPYQVVEFY